MFIDISQTTTPKILFYEQTEQKVKLTEILSDSYKLEIIHAKEIESLLEIAYAESVDLIILDLNDDKPESIEVLEYFDHNNTFEETPIFSLLESHDGCEKVRKKFKNIDFLHKPVSNQELINRFSIYLKLIVQSHKLQNSHRLIETQLRHSQEILNAQENMLAVFSQENIILANSHFLNFYGVNSIEDFILKYGCFIKTVVEEENTFKHTQCNEATIWINKLKAMDPNQRQVVINDIESNRHRFKIQLQSYQQEQTYTVITLFDMTDIYDRSKKYEQFAFYDQLTGVANRRKFEDRLDIEISRANRFHTALSIMMFDLDHFKSINDSYGHDKGDEILATFASTINKRVRKEDLFARWGGEEFILVLIECDLNHIFQLAQAFLEKTQEIEIVKGKRLTCSIGISHYENTLDKHGFIKLADDALYKAKKGGRNRFETI